MAGDSVRIKGLTSVGKVESIEGKQATVIFGGMRTKMAISRLEHVDAENYSVRTEAISSL